MIILYILLNS